MIKRTQNKIAESRTTLPVVVSYAILIWMAAGLLTHNWWIQFACFLVSSYLMVELNNQNALIRIYSRMVSCSFLVLSCAGNFLFPSLETALGQLCFICFLLLLFRTYQDKASPGGTFYAFVMMGLASLVHVRVFFFVPLFWLFMAFKIQSLSWRSFFASLFGLLLPYWFAMAYMAYMADFSPLLEHFLQLGYVEFPFAYDSLSLQQVLFYLLLVVIVAIGSIHYLRTRFKDKIRTRMLFDCFIITAVTALVLLAIQPQHFTLLLPISIVCASPLIAHFLALTSTRWTNIVFYVIITSLLALTAFNLWMLSSNS